MTGQPFPVEAGHIMMFARAIGDETPAHRGETVLAPPTFTMASAQYDPDHRLRPRQGEEWFGSGSGPGVMPEGGGGLHAEQHFEYHRPVRAGETLYATTVPGRSWEKQGRTGRLLFSERVTEYRDAAGEPVVSARTVAVVPEGPATPKDAR
ncbi:MaoC family dehydratase N-terminal domain-containing protein [Streptomyces phaeochromogenes]|uniref:FAS1-like dehydratase domain-containing protein n=1 Tax=Streptomyces phaeochromogenes TaxID=1923 RepID=UPI0006E22772|nr:MaoC family dehydratase N-terminal domain-containing protein [Streptomyces phaeochromogenes]MCX5602347.1 MaoC family dehydratase N-terminal domain-containing protein [Streptomyces phaeochromogenes]WRZ26878.1 MaoC family dehydratase N-terminal domain-containing protein [Streptomyces phaeochromogenes]WSS91190.1 MaoC family dehydratase N-terminal domain-containing protein [Streptomyces phaeochromogenes]WTA01944.1 MaoC family dehydratase N-terminal domain-containing protein [Streptomyces phaeoch